MEWVYQIISSGPRDGRTAAPDGPTSRCSIQNDWHLRKTGRETGWPYSPGICHGCLHWDWSSVGENSELWRWLPEWPGFLCLRYWCRHSSLYLWNINPTFTIIIKEVFNFIWANVQKWFNSREYTFRNLHTFYWYIYMWLLAIMILICNTLCYKLFNTYVFSEILDHQM